MRIISQELGQNLEKKWERATPKPLKWFCHPTTNLQRWILVNIPYQYFTENSGLLETFLSDFLGTLRPFQS